MEENIWPQIFFSNFKSHLRGIITALKCSYHHGYLGTKLWSCSDAWKNFLHQGAMFKRHLIVNIGKFLNAKILYCGIWCLGFFWHTKWTKISIIFHFMQRNKKQTPHYCIKVPLSKRGLPQAVSNLILPMSSVYLHAVSCIPKQYLRDERRQIFAIAQI